MKMIVILGYGYRLTINLLNFMEKLPDEECCQLRHKEGRDTNTSYGSKH